MTPARYNSIGFQGLNGAQTFVTLMTPEGEVRAFIRDEAARDTLISHNIGKTVLVKLGDITQRGMNRVADILDVKLA